MRLLKQLMKSDVSPAVDHQTSLDRKTHTRYLFLLVLEHSIKTNGYTPKFPDCYHVNAIINRELKPTCHFNLFYNIQTHQHFSTGFLSPQQSMITTNQAQEWLNKPIFPIESPGWVILTQIRQPILCCKWIKLERKIHDHEGICSIPESLGKLCHSHLKRVGDRIQE